MNRWGTEELTPRALGELLRTSLADVREGRLLKVVGRVELLEPMLSPLTRRPCVASSVKLQEKVATFDSLVYVVESSARDFVLRDETGWVVVRATNSSVFWEHDVGLGTEAWADRVTPEMRALLKKHELPAQDWVGELPYRFCEGVIEEGAQVTLIGRARREIDLYEAAGYRDSLPKPVFEAAIDPLILFEGATRWRIR